MPFFIQRIKTPPNRQIDFQFGAPVDSFLVGISDFRLTFGNDAHCIRDLSLRLDVKPSPIVGPLPLGGAILVDVVAQMNDASGHSISNDESWVTVVCIAFIGNEDRPIMGNEQGVEHGWKMGIDTKFPAVGCLSGFAFSYGPYDNRIQSVDLAPNSPSSPVLPTARLNSGSLQAQSAAIDGGYLAIQSPWDPSGGNHGIAWQLYDKPFEHHVITFQDFGWVVRDAAVLLREFHANFSEPRFLRAIAAKNRYYIDKDTPKWVWFGDAAAILEGPDGVVEDRSISGVTLALFAIPE